MSKHYLKLCLVTNWQATKQTIPDYFHFLDQAARGGITAIQLREKHMTGTALFDFAKQLRQWTQKAGITFIINDSLELALAVDADGVHLGQSDACPQYARRCLGDDKIIGWSIESLQELEEANHLPVNYLGASAVFPSKTKADCKMIWGLEGLHELISRSALPVVGIGGINQDNTPAIMQTGAAGIAVIGAIHEAAKPDIASQQLRQTIEESIYHRSRACFLKN